MAPESLRTATPAGGVPLRKVRPLGPSGQGRGAPKRPRVGTALAATMSRHVQTLSVERGRAAKCRAVTATAEVTVWAVNAWTCNLDAANAATTDAEESVANVRPARSVSMGSAPHCVPMASIQLGALAHKVSALSLPQRHLYSTVRTPPL